MGTKQNDKVLEETWLEEFDSINVTSFPSFVNEMAYPDAEIKLEGYGEFQTSEGITLTPIALKRVVQSYL
jgi:hypothetical protein